MRSFTGKKDVDAIKNVNKKIQSTERISKAYDAESKRQPSAYFLYVGDRKPQLPQGMSPNDMCKIL